MPNGFYIKAEQLKYELSDEAGEERADECADAQHSTHAPAGESDGCLDDSLRDGNRKTCLFMKGNHGGISRSCAEATFNVINHCHADNGQTDQEHHKAADEMVRNGDQVQTGNDIKPEPYHDHIENGSDSHGSRKKKTMASTTKPTLMEAAPTLIPVIFDIPT